MSPRWSLRARFYLGLGAPCHRAVYPECRVRAADGYTPELVRELLALRRGDSGAGAVEEVNFRCRVITPAGSDRRFFVKDFPRGHALHDIERALRCSRVDRAWRAAHLLPRFGILTPAPVGTAVVTAEGQPMEYLITGWLPDAMPYHFRLRQVGKGDDRVRMLREFAQHLRRWHDCGIYLRDLVTNVLTRESAQGLEYWLTDLDQLHPLKRITRRRLHHQMVQLARWTGPLTEWEAETIAMTYLSRASERSIEAVTKVLLETAPPA
ncbi:MAG: lipopolysaccharide kinase InaA family protein [Armatimonadota bacterium]